MEYDYKFKIGIIGDCNVGKSSLIKREVYGDFSDIYYKTIAIEYYSKIKKMRDKVILLDIWELSGNPSYIELAKAYLTHVQGIILIYDVTNKESFKNITKWIKLIEEIRTNNITYMLLANKIDKKKDRVVKLTEGIKFSLKKKIVYFEVSALKNITMDFLNIITNYLIDDNCLDNSIEDGIIEDNIIEENKIASIDITKNKREQKKIKEKERVKWCNCCFM
tara:strand:- start:2192 stop:2854 length:663 start_codon:yes stop_codon:yes gene_type:complete